LLLQPRFKTKQIGDTVCGVTRGIDEFHIVLHCFGRKHFDG
jgi:hypothetical protein